MAKVSVPFCLSLSVSRSLAGCVVRDLDTEYGSWSSVAASLCVGLPLLEPDSSVRTPRRCGQHLWSARLAVNMVKPVNRKRKTFRARGIVRG